MKSECYNKTFKKQLRDKTVKAYKYWEIIFLRQRETKYVLNEC